MPTESQTSDTLDFVIIDSGSKTHALIYARCDSDVAVATLPFDKDLDDLDETRRLIEDALYGRKDKPTAEKLKEFGHKLFAYLIRGDVQKLYTRLPSTHVRLVILGDCPTLQVIPWEYLQEPGKVPGPHAARSVVRVVKTIGVPPPAPLDFGGPLRVLFAYANPLDQENPVSWDDVRRSIHNSLNLHPDKYGLDIINEVTSKGLLGALNTKDYDIFHFSGHGTVVGDVGRLILNNGDDQSAYVTGEKLAVTLRGRDIRLVILSACHTASGSFDDDFSVIAKTLVEEGIPAVVANQMPVYDDTIAPFVGTLYSQLLKHGDLDRAVHQGRVALSTAFDDETLAPGEGAPLDWGVPTLYRHISASRMFKV